MPVAIDMFSLCTFAFGLSEFVVAGILSAIAVDLPSAIGVVGELYMNGVLDADHS